jgi:hypothetical protein
MIYRALFNLISAFVGLFCSLLYQNNSTLQRLNLAQNKMGSAAGLPLAKAMVVNRSLELLSLAEDAVCEVHFISACAGLGALAEGFELAGHTCTWARGSGSGGGSGEGNTAVVTKAMLKSFYIKHDPSAIERVDEILAAYTPAELNAALKAKYGEVPTDMGVWQESAPAPAPALASAPKPGAPAAPAEEESERNRAAFFAASPWEAAATDVEALLDPSDLPALPDVQAPAPPPAAPPEPEVAFTAEEAKAHAEKICEAVRKEVRGDEAMLNQFMAATRQMEKGKLVCPVVSGQPSFFASVSSGEWTAILLC